MKHRGTKEILLVGSLLLLLTLSFALLSCDPAVPLQVENQTDRALTIYVQDVKVGEVESNNVIKVKNLAGTKAYYLIEAKNSEGEEVYSRKFSFTELNDADWKVVIPPLQR